MALKKKTKPEITIDKEALEKLVEEYEGIRKQEAVLKKRKDDIAKVIKDTAMESGTADDKGSYYIDSDSFTYGAQAKTSVKFSSTAIDYLRANGHADCIIDVPTVDEGAVEDAFKNGSLTEEDLSNITETKTIYSVYVKAKEEMPEVQQSTYKAASKKTTTRKKATK